MTMTKLEAKTRLLAAMRLAEAWLGLEAGAIRSERRHKPVAAARQVIMLIGLDELGFSTTQLGRIMRRDHSTVCVGARAARALVEVEPWSSLHADLLGFIRADRMPAEPAPCPEPPPAPAAKPEPAAVAEAGGELWPVWPGRDYYERHNRAFVAAMRAAHPEREREIGRAPA